MALDGAPLGCGGAVAVPCCVSAQEEDAEARGCGGVCARCDWWVVFFCLEMMFFFFWEGCFLKIYYVCIFFLSLSYSHTVRSVVTVSIDNLFDGLFFSNLSSGDE